MRADMRTRYGKMRVPIGIYAVESGMIEKSGPEPADETRPDLPLLPDCGTYSESGVDLTVVRWMLSLTYKQRLDALQSYVNFVAKAKHVSPGAPVREHISNSPDSRG